MAQDRLIAPDDATDQDAAAARPAGSPGGSSAEPGYFGVMVDDHPAENGHVRIVHVVPDGPASRAGLRAGDQIVAIDGLPIRSMEDLARVITGSVSGRTLRLQIRRGDVRHNVSVTLGTRPPPEARLFPHFGRVPEPVAPPPETANPALGPGTFLGLQVAPLTEAVRRRDNLPVAAGVLVTDVARGSPAAKAGLLPGAVIVAVDGRPAGSLRDVSERLVEAARETATEITYYYRGQTLRTAVSLDRRQRATAGQPRPKAPLPPPEPAGSAARIERLEHRVRQLEERVDGLEKRLSRPAAEGRQRSERSGL